MVVHKTDQANLWLEHLQQARTHLRSLSELSRPDDFGQHLHAAAALELLSGQPGLATENLQRWLARQAGQPSVRVLSSRSARLPRRAAR